MVLHINKIVIILPGTLEKSSQNKKANFELCLKVEVGQVETRMELFPGRRYSIDIP